MTKITEDVIRKVFSWCAAVGEQCAGSSVQNVQRAEHNDGVLATLEEVSLHQLNIEKIDGLGHLCKHLRILYLQSNLISRLENLHKLKVQRSYCSAGFP